MSKSSFYNSAARLPFIIRPPRALQQPHTGAPSDALVELADLLPTFCRLAGVDVPDGVEGKDLIPLVMGERDAIRERLFGAIDGQHMVHDGRHKYLYFVKDGREQLFDHVADPNDLEDIAPAMPEKVREMRQHLLERLHDINSPDLENGTLRNKGETTKDPQAMRRRNSLGWSSAGRSLEWGGVV